MYNSSSVKCNAEFLVIDIQLVNIHKFWIERPFTLMELVTLGMLSIQTKEQHF